MDVSVHLKNSRNFSRNVTFEKRYVAKSITKSCSDFTFVIESSTHKKLNQWELKQPIEGIKEFQHNRRYALPQRNVLQIYRCIRHLCMYRPRDRTSSYFASKHT